MAKKKRRLEPVSDNRSLCWFDRLSSKDREALLEQVDAWLAGEYPELPNVSKFHESLRRADWVAMPVGRNAFCAWLGKYREKAGK